MVKREECLAYESGKWRFEWYVNDAGNSPSLEYYQEKLDEDQKTALSALFDYLAIRMDAGKHPSEEKIRMEGDGLFAFKPRLHRFMAFFVEGKTMIITHGFEKKQDDLPPNEKKKAKAYRRDYEDRNTKGCYYDEQTKGVRKST
jgi:hypothetical protein